MPSETEVSNMALGHLGYSKKISNLRTDKSAEGIAIRTFYDICVEKSIREIRPTFANKIGEALALVEEDPNEEWAYAYRYPSACLFFLRIQSGVRNDTQDSRVPYHIAADSQGKVIYTDKATALCDYISRAVDPSLWTPDYTIAFSLLLAAYIAPQVTGGDAFGMGKRALEFYMQSMPMAQNNFFMEQQDEQKPDSELIRSRD